MTIGDATVVEITQTDDQKNDTACEEIKRLCLHTILTVKTILAQANDAIAAAPGDKATILAKLGSDETDAETLLQEMVTLVNGHQATADADVSF